MRKVKPTYGCPVKGLVIANKWDQDGNVTDVVIYADNEEVYRIVNRDPQQDLLGAIQKQVSVSGDIIKQANGRMAIAVKSFEVIKSVDQQPHTPCDKRFKKET